MKKFRIFLVVGLLLIISCGGKSTQTSSQNNTEAAHLRTIGIFVMGQNDIKLTESVEQVLDRLYGSRTARLTPSNQITEELPVKTLYEAGLAVADDIIMIENPEKSSPDKNIKVSIYNTYESKIVAQFSFPKENNFKTGLSSGLAANHPDPNKYKKADPRLIADQLEKKQAYEEAVNVLKKMRKEDGTMLLQEMDEQAALDSKIQSLERLVKKQKCIEADKLAKYGFKIVKKGISDEYTKKLVAAIREADLNRFAGKYTNKPVKFRIHYDANSETGSMWLEMRYWPKWYKRIIAKLRIPKYISDKRVITFKPYFKLMEKIVLVKENFANKLPKDKKVKIMNMDTFLVLTKPCDETLEITAAKGTHGGMLHPYSIKVRVTGFGEETLDAADKTIFNKNGMFALGTSKTMSGDRTMHGILYDFLEIKE